MMGPLLVPFRTAMISCAVFASITKLNLPHFVIALSTSSLAVRSAPTGLLMEGHYTTNRDALDLDRSEISPRAPSRPRHPFRAHQIIELLAREIAQLQ